jgi:SAM-dependent methyltransferase
MKANPENTSVRLSNWKNPNSSSRDWLVYKIHDKALEEFLVRYASGVLVDIGCGEKQYARMTQGLVTKHLGVDHPDTQHARASIDVFATAYQTTLPDASADTVLYTAVLEHLERPQDAIREIYRILKPGGCAIVSAPFFWHLHEEPRDFFRYSRCGLEYLFKNATFQILELKALSGFIVTFGQESCYFLDRFNRRPFGMLFRLVQNCIQGAAYFLNRWDHSDGFSWAHMLVARKPALPAVL